MAAVGTAFFTTKIDGHGLGLYLAQAVLNRYNGSLELNNQPAGGVRVRLQLPLTALEI
jgi:signal transduction histidine kinase